MGLICFILLITLLAAAFICSGYKKKLIRGLDKKEHPVKLFYPLAAKLTDLFQAKEQRRKPKATDNLLRKLYVKENVEAEIWIYRVRKKAMVLTVLMAAFLFGTIISFAGDGAGVVTALSRNDPGQGTQNYSLQVEYEGNKEELSLPVEEEKYSRDEILQKLDESLDGLTQEMLGENESVQAVSKPLSFPSRYGDIQVFWEIEEPDLVGYNGEIRAELKDEETKVLNLKVTLTMDEVSKTYPVPVVLVAPQVSDKEALLKEIIKNIEENNSSYEKEVQLPESVNGSRVIFRRKPSGDGTALFILCLLAVAAVIFFYDKGLETRLKKRTEEMLTDFPEIVSKLNLLYEAGSSIRMAFERIVADQEKKGEMRFAYREMKLALEKIKSGESEKEAYAQFGKRCGLHPYIKLGNILEQNLSKGAKGMKVLLKQEVADAFEERKRLARKKGEEAGTKMLLPMILMMVIVVVIIAVPALMSIHL